MPSISELNNSDGCDVDSLALEDSLNLGSGENSIEECRPYATNQSADILLEAFNDFKHSDNISTADFSLEKVNKALNKENDMLKDQNLKLLKQV